MTSESRAFERLHPDVQRWVWEQQWTELRDAQEAAVEPVLAGRDVIVAAATASGKTEAAFLPIGSALAHEAGRSVRALVVSPLKALINDQFDRLDLFCERLRIPVHRWHGDVPAGRKQRVVREPSGILLITPESLEALFVVHGSRVARVFADLGWIVVDELHAFIGTERGRQLQSLAHRLELAAGHRIPRVGLSATLGDMDLAAAFLRPDKPGDVVVVRSAQGGREVRLQLRGYRTTDPASTPDDGTFGDKLAVAEHVFATLRGRDNLVFANSRSDVEEYADLLRRVADAAAVPNEFWPHHGSLAREIREDVERRLKEPDAPVTAVCTTTLELGIDVGSVASVAQVGAPPSVASLRQRLGRSGRRGDPAVIRVYVREDEIGERSAVPDRLRGELVQAIATVRLLAQGWTEPAQAGRLHLSTLVQQILSLVAERGGVRAAEGFEWLCVRGPFRGVDERTFGRLLKALHAHDLVHPSSDGTLLLGVRGERTVNHQSFFVAFATSEEYTLHSGGTAIGTLPLDHPLQEGSHLIFAGRRWRVVAVDADRRTIELAEAEAGRVPRFTGAGEPLHARVREEMLAVYLATDVPAFLDAGARDLLAEGRAWFTRFALDRHRVIPAGRHALLFPWTGDRETDTIVAMLQAAGRPASSDGIAVLAHNTSPDALRRLVARLADEPPPDARVLASGIANVRTNRYDRYLSDELARADYAARALDVEGAMRALRAEGAGRAT